MLEMLAYYRHKLGKFLKLMSLDGYESERTEWLQEIEQMSNKIENVQDMEAQVYRRKKEITELQKVLSDSHLAIYNEKSTINGLRLKYEDMRKGQREDERRLKELKALSAEVSAKKTKPVNFRDCRPESS